jgi:hypothetical protein
MFDLHFDRCVPNQKPREMLELNNQHMHQRSSDDWRPIERRFLGKEAFKC